MSEITNPDQRQSKFSSNYKPASSCNKKISKSEEWDDFVELSKKTGGMNSNLDKSSQIHSDDEVTPRRGLEQSMSSKKLKLLNDQYKEAQAEIASSMDSAALVSNSQIEKHEQEKRNNLLERMIRPGTICRESNFRRSAQQTKENLSSEKVEEDSVV